MQYRIHYHPQVLDAYLQTNCTTTVHPITHNTKCRWQKLWMRKSSERTMSWKRWSKRFKKKLQSFQNCREISSITLTNQLWIYNLISSTGGRICFQRIKIFKFKPKDSPFNSIWSYLFNHWNKTFSFKKQFTNKLILIGQHCILIIFIHLMFINQTGQNSEKKMFEMFNKL